MGRIGQVERLLALKTTVILIGLFETNEQLHTVEVLSVLVVPKEKRIVDRGWPNVTFYEP